jgi:acetyl-CoA C-acetyltransferase/acetyl-CoA acyltransferase
VNDGAAALLVASAEAVEKYGLTPLARVTGAAAAGVPPRIMGIGPVPATRKLLDRVGLGLADVDVVELNEAFAAQAVAVLRELGLPADAEHVNPNGGAIALGHPLGASGARLALTAAVELGQRGARRALCTMCIGVGQGISLLLEAPER